MINIKRLTENMQKMHPKQNIILEYTFSDLKQSSDPKRQARAKVGGMITNYGKGKLDQSKDGHARTHWLTSSQSGDGHYNQIVQIRVPQSGGLFSVVASKPKLNQIHNILKNAEIRVHCSCPDFYWSGMKYNLGPNGTKKGALAPETMSNIPREQSNPVAPNIRDPERKHIMCKHLLNVFSVFPFNATAIVKDLKTFANNNPSMIITNDQTTNTLDDGKVELDKDINRMQPDEGDEEGTVAVTEGELLKQPIDSLADAVAKSSEEGASELIDDQNDQILEKPETTEVDMVEEPEIDEPLTDDSGISELISDKNKQAIEPEVQQDVELDEIIDESPTEVITNVNDILDRSNSTESTESDEEDDDYAVNDVLSR